MIDRPALIAWRGKAPWPDRVLPELRDNLAAKRGNPSFRHDLDVLLTNIPADYAAENAADLIMRELGSKLRNAPPVDEITRLRTAPSD